MRTLLALCVLGCGSGSTQPAPASPVKMTVTHAPPPTVTPIVEDDGIEDLGVERLAVVRFTKNTVLRAQPDLDADEVGIIRKHARAAVLRDAEAGGGCKTRWLQLVPRGWACDVTAEPTDEEPTRPRSFSFTEDDPTPPVVGIYGVVRGKDVVAYDSAADAAAGTGRPLVGNNSVRAAGSVRIDGKRYWRTSGGDLIASSSIARFSPSQFRGVVIDGSTRMPAWIRKHGAPREPVITRAHPSRRAAATGKLAPRTIVYIAEETNGFARVGDDAWIDRRDLRATTLAPPPPGTGEDEKWFDVDLDDQVLVAYEGERPVYATLVSTGKRGRHATPTVIARIASKLERTTMSSDKEDVYSVADVPWTMFYDRNYALHSAYWHDGFGGVRSHGCINLAPHDARLLFRWSSPDIPPGWIAVYGSETHPGSLVRIRSSRSPAPTFRGYARRMRDHDNLVAR